MPAGYRLSMADLVELLCLEGAVGEEGIDIAFVVRGRKGLEPDHSHSRLGWSWQEGGEEGHRRGARGVGRVGHHHIAHRIAKVGVGVGLQCCDVKVGAGEVHFDCDTRVAELEDRRHTARVAELEDHHRTVRAAEREDLPRAVSLGEGGVALRCLVQARPAVHLVACHNQRAQKRVLAAEVDQQTRNSARDGWAAGEHQRLHLRVVAALVAPRSQCHS